MNSFGMGRTLGFCATTWFMQTDKKISDLDFAKLHGVILPDLNDLWCTRAARELRRYMTVMSGHLGPTREQVRVCECVSALVWESRSIVESKWAMISLSLRYCHVTKQRPHLMRRVWRHLLILFHRSIFTTSTSSFEPNAVDYHSFSTLAPLFAMSQKSSNIRCDDMLQVRVSRCGKMNALMCNNVNRSTICELRYHTVTLWGTVQHRQLYFSPCHFIALVITSWQTCLCNASGPTQYPISDTKRGGTLPYCHVFWPRWNPCELG